MNNKQIWSAALGSQLTVTLFLKSEDLGSYTALCSLICKKDEKEARNGPFK